MKVSIATALALAAVALVNSAELRGGRDLGDYPIVPWDNCGCSCICTGPVCAVPLGENPNPVPPNIINMTCANFADQVGGTNGEPCTDLAVKVNAYVAKESLSDCSGTFKTN